MMPMFQKSLCRFFSMAVLASIPVIFTPAAAHAVETRVLRDDTFADFNKGVSTGTALLADGRVQAGPRAVQVDKSSEGIAWDIAAAPDGSIYYSTGHSGKVFRISPEGEQELWADLTEVEATALALHSSGVLYIGASPGGKIYEVREKGKPALSWETGEKYVWDLAISPDGAMYAATGTDGKIFRISNSDSKAELWFDSDATNVMDLDFDAEGNLLAATQGKAYLIRISEQNKGYVLYAASQDELRSLTVGPDGNIYAVANSSRISTVFDKSTTSTASSDVASKLGGQGVMVQVHPNGFVNAFWTAPEGPVHAILADRATSSILAAAGKNGKLYSIDPADAAYSVVADIDEPMITALAHGPGAILLGAANKAGIYRLQPMQQGQPGQFASRALDAESTVRWGNLMFDGEVTGTAALTWETRSGNTPEPSDGNWSPWTSGTVVGDRIVKIESPIAQYLQYRLTIEDSAATVTEASFVDGVRVFYVEQNVPPVIKKIEAEKVPGSPGAAQAAALAQAAARIQQSSSAAKSDNDDDKAKEVSEEAAKAATAAARAAQAAATARRGTDLQNSQKLNITWTATDPNQDKLRYNLFYKGEDETVWKLIDDNLTVTRHQFSTEAIPDGQYRFKLEATDRFENPQTSASTVQAISRIYTVDNSPPEILDIQGRQTSSNTYEITARAVDKTSIISSAEYNLNAADEWLSLAPLDGIFDFQEEEFRFQVQPEEVQPEHTLSIRVYDQEGNSRVEKILLR